jgi:nucleotide-binding universal stress UspA family protein
LKQLVESNMRKIAKTSKSTASKRRRKPAAWRLRHILVPLDFSGQSRQALQVAVPLARQQRAKISLVHVVPPVTPLVTFPGDGVYLPVPGDNLNLLRATRAQLNRLAAELLPKNLTGKKLVREGNAAHEVVAVARSIRADLIVLSTHSRSSFQRVVFGSTAERIVRHAPCSVITVRRQPGMSTGKKSAAGKTAYPQRLPWKRILVPLDFSLTSLRALEAALPLAMRSGAALYLLNVVEPNPYAAGMDGAMLVTPDAARLRESRKQLPRVAEHFVPESIPVTSLVLRGRAAGVIVETALQNRVDLIVLSTHGHAGLDRLLLGSTAEQVVRHAGCPVLVVRKSPGKS